MSVGSRLSRSGGVRGRSALGRLRGSERHEENEEVILQITSLADVFTILLVF